MLHFNVWPPKSIQIHPILFCSFAHHHPNQETRGQPQKSMVVTGKARPPLTSPTIGFTTLEQKSVNVCSLDEFRSFDYHQSLDEYCFVSKGTGLLLLTGKVDNVTWWWDKCQRLVEL